jgi:hypothetical protein
MWTSFACAVGLMVLAPAQSDTLNLTNARFTYGPLGMERTNPKIYPGDSFFLAFDIENARTDPKTGKIFYDLLLELLDGKGKIIFSRDNPNSEVLNALNSSRQPSYASVLIGSDQKPGKYTLRVTVTDRATKTKTSPAKKAYLKKDFEVLKKGFGFVQVQAPAMSFVGGAPFQVTYRVEGFDRDAKKAPDLTVEMTILDENGKETLPKPVTMRIPKDLSEDVKPENITTLPLQYTFPLNKAGKFTVQLKATDNVAKKTIKLPLKITVLDPRKYESPK